MGGDSIDAIAVLQMLQKHYKQRPEPRRMLAWMCRFSGIHARR